MQWWWSHDDYDNDKGHMMDNHPDISDVYFKKLDVYFAKLINTLILLNFSHKRTA
jgi:hypothetical protein